MKYMLIDITAAESTSVLKVAPLRPIQLLGKIYQANGHKVIAPPVEGRSFAKLGKLELQYLYWNLCQETPPEDYALLVQNCLVKLNTLPVDSTPIEDLEREVRRLYPEEAVAPKAAPKNPGEPASRPAPTTTTGRVWEIADDLCAKAGGQIPDRKAVIAACEAVGINPATASTQFGKWKGSKLAGSKA